MFVVLPNFCVFR